MPQTCLRLTDIHPGFRCDMRNLHILLSSLSLGRNRFTRCSVITTNSIATVANHHGDITFVSHTAVVNTFLNILSRAVVSKGSCHCASFQSDIILDICLTAIVLFQHCMTLYATCNNFNKTSCSYTGKNYLVLRWENYAKVVLQKMQKL